MIFYYVSLISELSVFQSFPTWSQSDVLKCRTIRIKMLQWLTIALSIASKLLITVYKFFRSFSVSFSLDSFFLHTIRVIFKQTKLLAFPYAFPYLVFGTCWNLFHLFLLILLMYFQLVTSSLDLILVIKFLILGILLATLKLASYPCYPFLPTPHY